MKKKTHQKKILTKPVQVLVIVGPTASGKSGLAIQLAKALGGEVISADSRQVYRGLDIGTGKVTRAEMNGIRHHLLDVRAPRSRFTADDFVRHARRAIADIGKRGKLPIIAGGTGFYIDALMGRIALADVAPDMVLRKRLAQKSAAQLYSLLIKKDPARARSMDTPSERNNKLRLIRALEISSARTKAARHKPLSRRGLTSAKERAEVRPLRLSYEALWIGIMPDTASLDLKIKKRLSERLKRGMIAEAKRLHMQGLSYKRMIELGLEYRYLAYFLQKKISRQELESQLYTAIRRYARKQIGYWKRNTDIEWFEPTALREIQKRIHKWYLQ